MPPDVKVSALPSAAGYPSGPANILETLALGGGFVFGVYMETDHKIVEVKHRKSTKKTVLSNSDVREAARAGNACFQKFVDTGKLGGRQDKEESE